MIINGSVIIDNIVDKHIVLTLYKYSLSYKEAKIAILLPTGALAAIRMAKRISLDINGNKRIIHNVNNGIISNRTILEKNNFLS